MKHSERILHSSFSVNVHLFIYCTFLEKKKISEIGTWFKDDGSSVIRPCMRRAHFAANMVFNIYIFNKAKTYFHV